MKTTSLLLIGTLLAFAPALVACSSDSDSNTTSTSSTTGAGGGGSTTGAGGSGGSAATTGAGGAGGGSAALSCDSYCTTIMAACTDANAQYPDKDTCMATCAAFPEGMASDTANDSLGCRSYHATAAQSDAATHCPHAGPSGGGVCGDACTAYCDIVQHSCTGANQVYASTQDCLTACAGFDNSVPFSPGATGNNLACRTYHATAAAVDPATHCAHTGPDSAVCK